MGIIVSGLPLGSGRSIRAIAKLVLTHIGFGH